MVFFMLFVPAAVSFFVYAIWKSTRRTRDRRETSWWRHIWSTESADQPYTQLFWVKVRNDYDEEMDIESMEKVDAMTERKVDSLFKNHNSVVENSIYKKFNQKAPKQKDVLIKIEDEKEMVEKKHFLSPPPRFVIDALPEDPNDETHRSSWPQLEVDRINTQLLHPPEWQKRRMQKLIIDSRRRAMRRFDSREGEVDISFDSTS